MQYFFINHPVCRFLRANQWRSDCVLMIFYILLILCSEEKSSHDRGDATLLTAWPKYLNYMVTEGGERETERCVKIETIFRNIASIWHIYEVGQITSMAPDQRISQMNQALDRRSHYALHLWHISDNNLYANILHLFFIVPFMGQCQCCWGTILTFSKDDLHGFNTSVFSIIDSVVWISLCLNHHW